MNQINKGQTITLVQLALFSAIIMVMAFTPFLGYIPLGFTRATIIHIPVIIGCILLGPKKGAILGAVFGLTSLINNTMNPTVTSFVFTPFYSLAEYSGGVSSLIVCFLPRILVGVIPYYVYQGMETFWGLRPKKKQLDKKSLKKSTSRLRLISLATAGVAGALTNTLLVMNLIFILFQDTYAAANGVSVSAVYTFIIGIIAMNGIPEAIVSGIIVAGVGRVLLGRFSS